MDEDSSTAVAVPFDPGQQSAPATPLPWSWYWRFEDGEPNCGIFSEVRSGHAYAVARCPRYVKKGQWTQDAAFIVTACRAYADLVKACSAFIARFDSREGRRADTDYVAGLMRTALIKAAAPVDAVEEQGSRNRETPPSSPSLERVAVLEKALHDIEGKCADTIAGRINYRAGDLQSIARAALGEAK